MELDKTRPPSGSRRSGSRRMSRSFSRSMGEVIASVSHASRRSSHAEEDEEALRWAALEKLPTYARLRTSILKSYAENGEVGNHATHKEVDVRKLDGNERQQFIDKFFRVAEEDNEKFLRKFRNRIDKVGINLPTVEVRFDHLTIEADCYVGDRALPTLLNTARNIAESALGSIGITFAEKTKLTILKDASGIIKPSRMALLLGPPSSGKTTLLLALAGKLDKSLKVRGEVTYNGHKMNEFVPRKTSAYISQNDVHIGEMTVKETLDFSARCQGVGSRYELLTELAKRERDAGIFPEAELDLFMKATAMEGVESSLNTDYTLRILGMDVCRDTIVGDEMQRGISGGQKKRVTTGEMIVGPTKTLFMDEISTGLDSSTTFQIVKCLQQIVHLTEATIFMSLLQPAPETFDLFDDIILLSEGQIVYEGPREHVVEFFESCGFKCPERKGTADFLQEVTSRKDQEQYWADKRKPYRYVTVTEFASQFKRFHVGLRLQNELAVPYDKSRSHKAALVYKKYAVPTKKLLEATFDKEILLIKRNSFVYIFKTCQLIMVALVSSTLFLRTKMHTRNQDDGNLYIGAVLFGMIINMFNGYAELSMTIQRLPVFYKQRDLLFHPPWAFTLPNFLLRIPISIFESIIFMAITYYTIGLAPEASRFFKQWLVVFLIQQMAAGLFRLIAGLSRTMIIANTGGALILLLVFELGGFILPRESIPKGWKWGFWVSPMSYGFNALAVNEMYAPRWMNKKAYDNVTPLGRAVLHSFDVFMVPPPMNGFAQQALSIDPAMPQAVMNGFHPDKVAVYKSLVAEFAVFDRWFASVPASTQPNRLFVHSATSAGATSNNSTLLAKGYTQRTIFENLDAAGLSFGIYYQNIPATLFFRNLRKLKYLGRFRPYKPSFKRDAMSGKLPNYAVVEQRYVDTKAEPATDDHPSHDVYRGQMFVKEVYETLRAGPQWNQSLLIITYDEHGGFYDHVPTPARGVPSPDDIVGPEPFFFKFDRLGVRVPTILVSPWIDKATELRLWLNQNSHARQSMERRIKR